MEEKGRKAEKRRKKGEKDGLKERRKKGREKKREGGSRNATFTPRMVFIAILLQKHHKRLCFLY